MDDQKIFFSIKEVAQKLGVRESALRFWEKEFKELAPRKTPGGVRMYDADNIQMAELIHSLLKERKMTLEGARIVLKYSKGKTIHQEDIANRLKQVRDELLQLAKALEEYDKDDKTLPKP